MPSAIIVGGGIAGLVMARELVLGGLEVTLLEASDHLGGKVARHTVAGIELDAGAESFATRRDIVAGLARQLGLEAAITPPNPLGAWLQTVQGKAFPLPKTGILGIPGTALAADVIAVVGFWGAFRAQLDELLFGFAGSKERNLGRLVRRRMGRRVLERLVAPVTLGIHSRHPDDLDVDVVAPGLRKAMLATGSLSHAVRSLRSSAPAGTAVSGLVGGMFGLVEVLTRDLERFGVSIRLDCPVAAVDASTVTLADGDILEADIVVLAAPRGTGMLGARDPADSRLRAKAITHATAKWDWLAARVPPHRHVLRLSYDGVAAGRASDAQLRDCALRDAGALLGVDIDAASVVAFARVDWSAPARSAEAVDGVTVVGEGAAGTGLAAVVAHARQESGRLLEEVEA
jgi:oxygen-dependent protoporphyrinogen oxidase